MDANIILWPGGVCDMVKIMANLVEETSVGERTAVMEFSGKPKGALVEELTKDLGIFDERKEIFRQVLVEIGGDVVKKFGDELNQGFKINRERSGGELSKEQEEAILVGLMTEWVGRVLPVGEVQTVWGGDVINEIKLVGLKDVPGLDLNEGTKGGILRGALRKGLEDSSLDERDKGDFVSGMGGYEGGGGESYQTNTTLPDGFILKEGNELVGVMDVKGYSDDEIRTILEGKESEEGGVSKRRFEGAVEGMVKFWEIVRRNLAGEIGIDERPVVLLRFAADIGNDELQQLAEALESRTWGQEGSQIELVIQKLPFDRKEMMEIGRALAIKVKIDGDEERSEEDRVAEVLTRAINMRLKGSRPDKIRPLLEEAGLV